MFAGSISRLRRVGPTSWPAALVGCRSICGWPDRAVDPGRSEGKRNARARPGLVQASSPCRRPGTPSGSDAAPTSLIFLPQLSYSSVRLARKHVTESCRAGVGPVGSVLTGPSRRTEISAH